MKFRQSLATLLIVSLSGVVAAKAEPQRAAIFGFELDDTSLEGEKSGPRRDEQARLRQLDSQLRDLLAGSGEYLPVDTASIATEARSRNLWDCGGCEAALAAKAGAQVAVIGWVQKVSNLILNINVVIRDASSGAVLHAGSVDIRGNTDESWSRGLSYLVRNRLLSRTGE
jgi:hypothetical protein